MIKILTNNKSAGFMIMPLVLLSLGILSAGSYSWASDAELSESSTAQTYYDSLIGYQQKQGNDLMNFKEGVNRNVTGLKEDIKGLNSKIKTEEHKYKYDKGSVALGSLYGSKGKLGLDKGKYNKNSATAVTDTETLETLSPKREILTGEPKMVQPPVVPVCTQVCQTGYGNVTTCNTVCR